MNALQTAAEAALDVLRDYVAFAKLAEEGGIEVHYSPHSHLAERTSQAYERLHTALCPPVEASKDELYKYLDLTIRTANILREEGIDTLEVLLSKREPDLLRIPACGRKTLNEIVAALRAKGLQLKEHRQ